MEDLESKSAEELITIIEELNESIEEKDQAIDELQEKAADLVVEAEQFEHVDTEEVADSAFNAGFVACEKGGDLMRSWLNYKIEARI